MELRVDVLMGSGLVCGCMELRVDVKRGQGWYGAEAGCVEGEQGWYGLRVDMLRGTGLVWS